MGSPSLLVLAGVANSPGLSLNAKGALLQTMLLRRPVFTRDDLLTASDPRYGMEPQPAATAALCELLELRWIEPHGIGYRLREDTEPDFDSPVVRQWAYGPPMWKG
jgi:hypothetical protein